VKKTPLKRRKGLTRTPLPSVSNALKRAGGTLKGHGAILCAKTKNNTSLANYSVKQTKKNRELISVKKELAKKSDGLCGNCGKSPDWRGLSTHHLKFLSRGGSNQIDNLILICGKCHNHFHNIWER
jgi:hypothetical protein